MTKVDRHSRLRGVGGSSGGGGGGGALFPPSSSSSTLPPHHHHHQADPPPPQTLGPDTYRYYHQQQQQQQQQAFQHQRPGTPSSSSAQTSDRPPTPESSSGPDETCSPPDSTGPSKALELQEGVVEMAGTIRQQREPLRGRYEDGDAAEAGGVSYGSCGSDKDDRDGVDDDGASTSGSGSGEVGTNAATAGFQPYTSEEEKMVVRKFDRRLVLFMALLYMLNFLDRSNIGNARIAGMEDDLQTTPRRDDWYEWALTGFYVAYIVFEWMAVLWKVVSAHVYVSVIVFSWGVIASLQAVAVNYPMLISLRVLLGISEAAFTGVPVYLSFFFKRHELAFRTAIFISAAPLSSTFASTLAWLIVKLGESSPIAPWRLLFLLEGFPSVIVAVAAWSLIPDSPQAAHYLTPREKEVAYIRLRGDLPETDRHERAASSSFPPPTSSGRRSRLDVLDALRILADPVAWMMATIFFLTNMAYSSLPVFLPTILESMGHDQLAAQGLAAPPYLFAFVVVLVAAAASDRARARGVPVALLALFSAAGYGTLALSAGHVPAGSPARYAAVFPAAAGFFGVVALTISWAVNNQHSSARRGSGFALLQAVGQCGPLLGARLYPDAHAPFYQPGMAVCACAMLAVAAIALSLRAYLTHLNRRLPPPSSRGKLGPAAAVAAEAADDEGGDGDSEEDGLVGPRLDSTAATRFVYML